MPGRLLLLLLLTVPLAARQAPVEQAVAIESPAGTLDGLLVLPAEVRRPRVALIVGDTGGEGSSATGAIDPARLSELLAARGVATLRYRAGETPAGAASPGVEPRLIAAAAAITSLRNDARFPTVTVIGQGELAATAAIAARAARADAFVALAPAGGASAEVERLSAAVLAIEDRPAPEDAADRVGAFVASAPVLGRRGTSRNRPVEPRRSPRQTVMASVAGARVTIEHGSPQKRGREIWGALVPWNRVWMPGADESTTLTTDRALAFGDVTVPAGDVSVYTLPAADRMLLVLNRETGQFHTIHDAGQDLGRVPMTLSPRADEVEGLTFAIEPRAGGGTLRLTWDDRDYTAAFTVR
jgi:hypothetical protein